MNQIITDNPALCPSAVEQRAGKYLTFDLGREQFGIRVIKVREIMGIQEITEVPQTAPHVKGVINLRGKVIPVIDLRVKLGLEKAEYSSRTCIVVVQSASDSGSAVGVVVDGVSEVLNLASSDIEDTPDFGGGVPTPYLLGVAKVKGHVKLLLDIDQLLGGRDSLLPMLRAA